MYTKEQLLDAVPSVPVYAREPNQSGYVAAPTSQQIQNGAAPLDPLPVQWWNYYQKMETELQNSVRTYVAGLFSEVIEVIGTANGTDTTQLKAAIQSMINASTVSKANSVVAGCITGDANSAVAPASGSLAFDTVGTVNLRAGAVATAKIADLNVTTAKIANLNVTTAKIADLNVTTAKIADLNVTTAKIANNAVTVAKLATSLFSTTATNAGAASGTTYGTTSAGTSTTTFSRGDHSHKVTISNASTTVTGVVKLNANTNSTSTSEAATASAVKSAYDTAYSPTVVVNIANGQISVTVNGTTSAAVALPSATSVERATYARYLVPNDSSTDTRISASAEGDLTASTITLG